MSGDAYIHGYTADEQTRLIEQAEYWRDSLILPGLEYGKGGKLLEIGCAAGASLGVIARAFPKLELAGIDIEPAQIAFAQRHLASLGVEKTDLREGNATALPWDDGEFDHVYVMWLLEHLADPHPVLAEAFRVLRPGGTMVCIETDYTTFRTNPVDADFDYLILAQYDLFARDGNPVIGPQLGALLSAAGFESVRSNPVGFHFIADGSGELRAHADYVAAFLEPQISLMVKNLDCDKNRLERGLHFLRNLSQLPESSLTQIVYKAFARRP